MENNNNSRIVSKEEVTKTLLEGLQQDRESFLNSVSILNHGQKNRLIEAMVSYPIVDVIFDNNEPELRSCLSTFKRISDSLVAIGTEIAIEGIINSVNNKNLGEANVNQE